MKNSWKTIWPAALGVAWLAVTADAREGVPMTDRTLTVLVIDYAGASGDTVNQMEALSSVLLLRAGVRTEWVHCLGQPGSQPPQCDANLGSGLVLLRIQAAYPGNQKKRGDPLGTAEIESHYASIYASDIDKYARQNGLPAGTLMAYAATHEIGHLLLGPGHSPSGIMSPVLGKAEYTEMAQRWLGFSESERQALRRAVPALPQRLAGLK